MLQDKKTASKKIESHAVAQSPGSTAISQPFVPQSLQLKNIEAQIETPAAAGSAIKPFIPSNPPAQTKSDSKDTISPFQLIQKKKQKRIKPAIQKKTENQVKGSDDKILQRKVLIQGVPMEKDLKNDDVALTEQLSKKSEWLTDEYKRDYKSKAEFIAHAKGDPVQCGLIPTLALWYRLPLPSTHASITPKFFLLGEIHNISPLRLIVQESNQQSAKVLAEGGGSFANKPLVHPDKPEGDLPIAADNPNTRTAELGLAKTLFAFADLYEPLKREKSLIRLDPNVNERKGASPEAPPEMMVSYKNLKDWDEGAEKSGPLYRHVDGRPYYIAKAKDGKTKGYIRTNISVAKDYNQHKATDVFLEKETKEIIEVLGDDSIVADFNKIRKEGKGEGPDYELRYNRVFKALRDLSTLNIKNVYPGQETVGRTKPKRKPGATDPKQLSDIEIAMNHRNTAMVGALEHASKGGYAMASFGAQHVIDIKAWYRIKRIERPFDVITYDDLVQQQSAL